MSLPNNSSEPVKLLAAEESAKKESAKLVTIVNTRRWRRYPLDVPIRVIVQTPEKTKLYDGRGNELSEGGMAVTAGVELKAEDTIAIEFTPPYAANPIRVRGTVRNRQGYRYGVEFLVAGVEELEQVDRLKILLQTLSHS